MATIYIYNYNNYFNREVRMKDTIAAYGTPLHVQNNVNFNPNDGVSTGLTVGRAGNAYSGVGDYLIVDDEGDISRWFIIDHVRRLKGQWRLTLRRDVLVDFYDEVINSTAFIQRATVPDISPFIYNQEPITVNQIKQKELLLKDSTKVAWLCGFLSRNYDGSDGDIALNASQFVADEEYDTIDDYTYKQYIGNSYYRTKANLLFRYLRLGNPNKNLQWTNFETSDLISEQPKLVIGRLESNAMYADSDKSLAEQTWAKETMSYFRLYSDSYFPTDRTTISSRGRDLLLQQNGKIILDKSAQKYYKVNVNVTNVTEVFPINYDVYNDYLYTKFGELFPATTTYIREDTYQLQQLSDVITLSLQEVSAITTKIKMPNTSQRLHLKDAPYDMFCVPFGEVTLINSKGAIGQIKINPSQTMLLVQDLVRQLGANIYDLQLLPFCPMTGFSYTENGELDINTSDSKRYTIVYDEAAANDAVCILLWSTASQGTFNIVLDEPLTVENLKMSNQCDLYRLVSPNYNGQFEFNLAKNGGTVNYFNVDYTYLPYSSYIHVNPQFAGLYGDDFNDIRGLICQGDFSVSYLSDQWANYQIQNKNYNNIFDRQIANMEVNHKYDMQQGAISALAGAAAMGIGAGAMTGNVGVGIAAGIASAAGGVADLAYNEARYKEQRSYAEDVHQMQLENIRAMPYSVAKTTAYSANNKVFPVLEYYTCTDHEKQAVANSIRQSGMTVGVVGTIRDYAFNQWSYSGISTRGFIQAQLIELPINEDYHTSAAIAEELIKGVYYL